MIENNELLKQQKLKLENEKDALILQNQQLLLRNGPLIEALNRQKSLIETITSVCVEHGLDNSDISDYIIISWLRNALEERDSLRATNIELRLDLYGAYDR